MSKKNMARKKKYYDIVTIFPEIVEPYLQGSILGRAQKNGLLKLTAHDLRLWSPDKKHHKVDDTPYGGGPGMVMQIEPFHKAVSMLKQKKKKTRVILTSASGKRFTQEDVVRFSVYDQLIFLCGRYEGVDARVETDVVDESISIGDYVLTGGELAALVITDAVARLHPGVLGKGVSLEMESHTTQGILEYPQYTKPFIYEMKNSPKGKKHTLKVPEILLSGNHKEIEKWRQEQMKHT